MLKETRMIDKTKVRNLCVKNGYYTCETNEEYDNMFSHCEGKMTIRKIEYIAKDIFIHSDVEMFKNRCGCSDEELFENIAFELINDCCCTTIETINPR